MHFLFKDYKQSWHKKHFKLPDEGISGTVIVLKAEEEKHEAEMQPRYLE